MTLAEFILSLATSAGLSPDLPALKEITGNESIKAVAMPVEVGNIINQNLMTMESAKNNTTIRNHFWNQSMNGLDAELQRTMDELELDDATKTKILAEKSSTKRASLLAKEIKDLEIQKAGKSTGDKKELQDKINALEAEKAKIANDFKSEIENLKSAHENTLADYQEDAFLSGYKFTGDQPDNVKQKLAKILINEEMAAKGYIRKRDENGNFVLLKNDGTKLFVENKEIDYKTFAEQTFAQNKILQTNGGGSGGGGNDNTGVQQKQTQQQTVITGGGTPRVNNQAIADIDVELAPFK